MSELRECILHRGCCRIVMLVASGPALRASPRRRFILSAVQVRFPPCGIQRTGKSHPANRAGVRSRQAVGSAPKSIPVPPGGSEAGPQCPANPLFRDGEPPWKTLPACLHPAFVRLAEARLSYAFQKTAVDRLTVERLSLHLRFAGPIRRSTTRVFRYCCGHRRRIVWVKISLSLSGAYSR